MIKVTVDSFTAAKPATTTTTKQHQEYTSVIPALPQEAEAETRKSGVWKCRAVEKRNPASRRWQAGCYKLSSKIHLDWEHRHTCTAGS